MVEIDVVTFINQCFSRQKEICVFAVQIGTCRDHPLIIKHNAMYIMNIFVPIYAYTIILSWTFPDDRTCHPSY